MKENENLVLEKKDGNCLRLNFKSQPYLIGIDEASSEASNDTMIYPLRYGKTLFGSNGLKNKADEYSDGDQTSNILLYGSDVTSRQCYLTRLDNKCYLCPLSGYCQLNDRVLKTLESLENDTDIDLGVELKHGDLILLGSGNFFVFNNSSEFEEERQFNEHKRVMLSNLMKQLVKLPDIKTVQEDEICLNSKLIISQKEIIQQQLQLKVFILFLKLMIKTIFLL